MALNRNPQEIYDEFYELTKTLNAPNIQNDAATQEQALANYVETITTNYFNNYLIALGLSFEKTDPDEAKFPNELVLMINDLLTIQAALEIGKNLNTENPIIANQFEKLFNDVAVIIFKYEQRLDALSPKRKQPAIVEIPETSEPAIQRKVSSDCDRVSAGLLILAGATIFAAAVTLTLISVGIIPALAIAGITIAATKLGLIGGLFGLGVGGTLFGMGVKKARDVEIELATLPRPVIKAA